MIALPTAAACAYLIPTTPRHDDAKVSQLDLVSVSTLTAAITLFVYALTTGSVSPWASAGVLVPLFVSVAFVIAFFVHPKLWFYPNFAVLFAVALMPYFWWIQIYFTFSPYWQDVLHWSSIITGVKFLPLGIVGGFIMINGGHIARLSHPKFLILGGLTLPLASSLMLPFSAHLRDQHCPLVFPAFIICTAGTAVVFAPANIAFFRTTPPEYAGTSSVTTSIQASVDERANLGPGFTGRSAALWFVVAYVVLEIVAVGVFYREERLVSDPEAKTLEVEQIEIKETMALAA
ncbi:hypothetical protein FRC10_011702 [Ceratobasidium sp. 414]|nr:hypothetical protein FRC10_011702 [Ceratobasidium sp. 414]